MNIFVGILLGCLAGLGVGGGSLLMLWLTLVQGLEQNTAKSVNLLFFLPAAAISCIIHSHRGNIPWKTVLPALAAGCVSAAVSGILFPRQDSELLRKLWGGFLIIIGIREIAGTFRKK